VSLDFIRSINQGHKEKRVQSFLEQLPVLYMVFEQMSTECGVHFRFSCGITEQILMKFIYFKFYVASLILFVRI
jgi:hypothetical protein